MTQQSHVINPFYAGRIPGLHDVCMIFEKRPSGRRS